MLYVLLIGLLAGAIAGTLIRGKGYGCLVNIVVGIIGAFVGQWFLSEIGVFVPHGIMGRLITAVIGAVIFLFVLNLMRKILE